MATITVIDEVEHTVTGEIVGGRVLVDPAGLPDAIGWELKAEGLCRDDGLCPGPRPGGDLRRRAGRPGRGLRRAGSSGRRRRRRSASSPSALPSEERRRVLDRISSPAVHAARPRRGASTSSVEWRGLKKLLVAFSTW